MKAGFVGLIGRPSCGKSTFLNRVCGAKVSIVSSVPQTTRNRIRGILNAPEGQLVFIDTPGFHLSEKKMNLYLRELAFATLKEVDAVLYMVDASRSPGEEERALMATLAPYAGCLAVGINKIDIAGNLEAVQRELRQAFPASPILPISALTGLGIAGLLEELWRLAPEGEHLYPQDLYTDQSPEFRIAEIVREKAILQTREEVPHALYVELSDLEMREEGRLLWARGFLCVERESQKGILVGRNGERIRSIVRAAEEELAGLFPYQVKLDIRVKTRPKWRRNDALLKKLIG